MVLRPVRARSRSEIYINVRWQTRRIGLRSDLKSLVTLQSIDVAMPPNIPTRNSFTSTDSRTTSTPYSDSTSAYIPAHRVAAAHPKLTRLVIEPLAHFAHGRA